MPKGTVHELKIWPRYFVDVAAYTKRFELRADDRDPKFAAGDTLRLREWDEQSRQYTGRNLWVRVLYVLRGDGRNGLSEGMCILSITDPSDPHEGLPNAVGA